MKKLHEGVCIETFAELGKGKKEEYVKDNIRKRRSLSNTDMEKIFLFPFKVI